MYYFFLGRYLATSKAEKTSKIIEDMCQESHITAHHLTLLFVIHHATDNEVIDDITLMTMCTLDNISPARLDKQETKRFRRIISELPTDILSDRPVEVERRAERDAMDLGDDDEEQDGDYGSVSDINRACYQILKNNEILGQILRARYGKLEKKRIAEIIEAVADGGLRLVNSLFSDEEDIAKAARYVHDRVPDLSEKQIRKWLRFLSLFWTMANIEWIVNAISHREIRGIVNEVVRRKGTPAYDIIGFFSALDNADELTDGICTRLRRLLANHDDFFVRGVLSFKTQDYMNTHRSPVNIEQAVCAHLQVKYRHRLSVES